MNYHSSSSSSNKNYSEGILSDEPFQRPSIMDQFDMMVLRAAENKRKDILHRYGDEGCTRLLARKERQGQSKQRTKPARSKSHYEKTIQDLRDSQTKLSPSQKENQMAIPVQEETKDNYADDDFDIDELFELAWGGDISTEFKKETTKQKNNNSNDNDNGDDDEAFAKKLHQGSVRKLLKARETTRATRSWRVRKTRPCQENCSRQSNTETSNRSRQWNLAWTEENQIE